MQLDDAITASKNAITQQQICETVLERRSNETEKEIQTLKSQLADSARKRTEVEAISSKLTSKLSDANSARERAEGERARFEVPLSEILDQTDTRITLLKDQLTETEAFRKIDSWVLTIVVQLCDRPN